MIQKRMAYAAFEETIISLYEQRLLTLDLLDHIARQYRSIIMDSAGSRYLRTQDNKGLHQICIELVDPTFPIAHAGSSTDHEESWEQELKKWEEIVCKRWQWQIYCTALPIQPQQKETFLQEPLTNALLDTSLAERPASRRKVRERAFESSCFT